MSLICKFSLGYSSRINFRTPTNDSRIANVSTEDIGTDAGQVIEAGIGRCGDDPLGGRRMQAPDVSLHGIVHRKSLPIPPRGWNPPINSPIARIPALDYAAGDVKPFRMEHIAPSACHFRIQGLENLPTHPARATLFESHDFTVFTHRLMRFRFATPLLKVVQNASTNNLFQNSSRSGICLSANLPLLVLRYDLGFS